MDENLPNIVELFVVIWLTRQYNPMGHQVYGQLLHHIHQLIGLPGDLLLLGTFTGHVTCTVPGKGGRDKVYSPPTSPDSTTRCPLPSLYLISIGFPVLITCLFSLAVLLFQYSPHTIPPSSLLPFLPVQSCLSIALPYLLPPPWPWSPLSVMFATGLSLFFLHELFLVASL